MAHGQPDFGMYSLASTIYKLADMGELAARLGSIDTFDRRGDVVWLDDFEDNIAKWLVTSLGTGAGVALSTEAARNGAKSAKITTGNAQNDYASIAKYLGSLVTGEVGAEISFTLSDSLIKVMLYLFYYDGTNQHFAGIDYRLDNDTLYYVNAAGGTSVIAAGVALAASQYLFHTIKLVIDLKNDKYARLILDGVEYDLSSYSYQVTASAAGPFFIMQFEAQTNVADNISIYADDAIITQNEP